jgi:hypothetical protein
VTAYRSAASTLLSARKFFSIFDFLLKAQEMEMAQPGRKSFGSTSVRPATNGRRPRLSSPEPLTKSQQAIFNLAVAKNGHAQRRVFVANQ